MSFITRITLSGPDGPPIDQAVLAKLSVQLLFNDIIIVTCKSLLEYHGG